MQEIKKNQWAVSKSSEELIVQKTLLDFIAFTPTKYFSNLIFSNIGLTQVAPQGP